MTRGGDIAVGTRLFFERGLWEVTELAVTAVVLRDALGGLRQTSISGLLGRPPYPSAGRRARPAGPDAGWLTPPETEENEINLLLPRQSLADLSSAEGPAWSFAPPVEEHVGRFIRRGMIQHGGRRPSAEQMRTRAAAVDQLLERGDHRL